MSQEGKKRQSVWDYPRPPAIEHTTRHLKVIYKGIVLADTKNAYRILETSHPPTYYIPPKDVLLKHFVISERNSFCEWKGTASYYDVKMNDDEIIHDRVWFYIKPNPAYANIKNYLSFYPSPFECYVDGEKVNAQEGDFYGGWITSDIDGGERGFKGGLGTWGW
ncbi:hypothetical protein G9A89_016610 [Geosiphon pyriformis]|nr:hypothetical protein G9A89_016610 [Geosiphon pyriformis]